VGVTEAEAVAAGAVAEAAVVDVVVAADVAKLCCPLISSEN